MEAIDVGFDPYGLGRIIIIHHTAMKDSFMIKNTTLSIQHGSQAILECSSSILPGDLEQFTCSLLFLHKENENILIKITEILF